MDSPCTNHIRYASLLLCLFCCGCTTFHTRHDAIAALKPVDAPRELCKANLPEYRIEPPDILGIEVVRTVPKSTYRLKTTDVLRVRVSRDSIDRLVIGDLLSIRVPGAPALSPVDGNFLIQPDGSVSLGTPYGSVVVSGVSLEEAGHKIEQALSTHLVAPKTFIGLAQAATPIDQEYSIEIDGAIDFGSPYGQVQLDGLTLAEAKQRLTQKFANHFANPSVGINLIQASSLQQVVGEHLVGPDGRITLGIYGSVNVSGYTLEQASAAIEASLSTVLDKPEVALSVLSYNSKIFYVITQGPGIGDAVYRYPITGNETVLDALSLIQGVPQGSSNEMWIARPTGQPGKHQLLPIEWEELTALAETNTNYQLMPGDRLYIQRDPFVTFDTRLAKFISPIERVFGISILSAETATRLSGKVLSGGGNPRTQF
ncbi:Polysaccharide biosynthesis/export protein [Stieleria neptunia]|uniref:Polysaccharide biosynthesis/export protein n=1 Tax=Stieleria neptunia TaxID=2527979 RepID=A0A518HN81_9BACT|nr:polysaccharide biosynthesis/export family protein [Stieleria neptunia]QDV42314.1 Polysaccharide biosynthesis/export protein [Stieleria neptunia]